LPEADELNEIKDSVNYKNILGTYVFNPTEFQAKKLNINKDAIITLKITTDSLEKKKSGAFVGKYYIDNMILADNWQKTGPYSSNWVLSYFKEPRHNQLSLNQDITHSKNMSFQLERSSKNDTLHIVGYTSDPKYEVIKIVDFKKVK
jgi:hypothetical protein